MRTLLLAPHNLPTEAEIAWAAGLFEGEGCARVREDIRNERLWLGPYFSLRMKDEEPVRAFHAIVGFGNVRHANQWRADRYGKIWAWESGSKRDAHKMEMLLPWLSPRRRAAVEAALEVAVFGDPAVKAQRIREAQAKRPLRYCECGRGPMPDGALGRHRKACKEVVPL